VERLTELLIGEDLARELFGQAVDRHADCSHGRVGCPFPDDPFEDALPHQNFSVAGVREGPKEHSYGFPVAMLGHPARHAVPVILFDRAALAYR